jgi:hypothetical protein
VRNKRDPASKEDKANRQFDKAYDDYDYGRKVFSE